MSGYSDVLERSLVTAQTTVGDDAYRDMAARFVAQEIAAGAQFDSTGRVLPAGAVPVGASSVPPIYGSSGGVLPAAAVPVRATAMNALVALQRGDRVGAQAALNASVGLPAVVRPAVVRPAVVSVPEPGDVVTSGLLSKIKPIHVAVVGLVLALWRR